MSAAQLALKVREQFNGCVELVVKTSMPSRISGGDPWFEVKLTQDGGLINGACANQPLSCLQAVVQGRKTALMCTGGILAISADGEEVQVEYHKSSGPKIHAACSISDYSSLIASLTGE